MKTTCLILALALLSGCSSVITKDPFPDSTLTQKEMDSMRGTWQLEDTVIYLDFTTNGAPRMASVEWKDQAFALINHELHITKQQDAYYLSLQVAEPGEESDGYLFAEFKPRDDDALVWGPNVDFFKKAVENGMLKGSVKDDKSAAEIRLTGSPAKILELLSSDPAAIDRENPLVFKKLD